MESHSPRTTPGFHATPVWRVHWVAETASTNADLLALAAKGAPEGSVFATANQTAGRGRLDRTWTAPPGTALAFSMLLRPTAAPSRWPLLPLLAGVGVVDALRRTAGVHAELKWPNDVLVGGRKLAGILAEAAGGVVVVGVGINVALAATDLPVPTATSLLLEGAATDREALLKACLPDIGERYTAWSGGDDGALLDAYRERCATLGLEVRVHLPDGDVGGVAVDVDAAGRLVLETPGGERIAFAAGDVVHVR